MINLLEHKCSTFVEMMETMLQGFTGDLFNYVCGDYNEDSDKCQYIIDKIKPWTKPLEWKSFILPVVQIVEKNPPRNMSQMNYWCRKFKQSIECVRQYSQQCLQSESRRVFSIMSYSISKMAKRYCGSVRAKKDLLEFLKCAGNDLRKYAQPLFDLSGDLHSIPTIKPANLPTGDVIKLGCTEYTDDSDKCDTIIGRLPKWNKPLEWKSFIIPSVKIVDSLH
ncbi:hypothetical protein DERF_004029 [Dermatophagoides farinae]|uniref:Uncharacterized protein n=1 Tax=Dermatophagoides farinae TaxID=6954 RepID=A0A922IET5_DERFA|nr:hypothetical protein DERF_004029 [Dermatophagoides farinae]